MILVTLGRFALGLIPKSVADHTLDLLLWFNFVCCLAGYYFDPTTRDEDLTYCRQVLLYRPGRAYLPLWIRDHGEAERAARMICERTVHH